MPARRTSLTTADSAPLLVDAGQPSPRRPLAMVTLDPEIRDLLVAIHGALDAAEHKDYPVCAAQTAIRSTVLYGHADLVTRWVLDDPQLAEAADARRVRRADQWDLYLLEREGRSP